MATTSKDSHKKKMNQLSFGILDDHNDPIEHTEQALNRYFVSASIPSIMNRDEKAVVIDDNDDADSYGEGDGDDSDDDDEDMNDDHLSQKMSELSVMSTKRQISTSTIADMITKKVKISDQSDNDEKEKKNDSNVTMDNNNENEDQIPDYLLATNPLFDRRMKKVLNETNMICMDELREIAVIKHHLGALDHQKRLFLMYQSSGRGTLEEDKFKSLKVDRQYWPNEVRSMKQASDDTEETYEHVLRQRLENMDHRIGKYQNELVNLTCRCVSLTTIIEEAIDSIVNRHGIEYYRNRCDVKIALLKYEYEGAILERQYLLEKPNDYQIVSAHRLYQVRFEYERARRILMELKQSVFDHRISKEYHAKILSMIKSNEPTELSSCNRYEQAIRQKITDFIATRIANAEQKYNQCRKRMHAECEKVWKRHNDGIDGCVMPKSLIDLIEKQLVIITERWRAIYNYRINIYIDADMLKYDTSLMNLFDYSPCMYIHTTHTLTKTQMKLLNRGPTYVIPCQMLSTSANRSMNDIIKELYAPLKQKMYFLFSKYHVNIALSMDLEVKIRDEFKQKLLNPISIELQQRVSDEKKVMHSIRRSLDDRQQSDLILRRTADDMNTFYLGNRKEFNEKSKAFMNETDIYELQVIIAERHDDTEWQNDIHRMIESMNSILRRIFEKKNIDDDVLQRLTIDISLIKIPFLYFLPQISRNNEVSVVPIISVYESPTWKLGLFLDRLIRPVARRSMQLTAFIDEIDVAQKLRYFFCKRQPLTSNTLFATIDVTNYYTMSSHESMAEVLGYFFRDNYPSNKVENISIVQIQNLVRLFLYNNIFIYDDKIYSCAKGSPITMPLTETLANIYLCQWQTSILREIQSRHQFFGRLVVVCSLSYYIHMSNV